jgi:predicted permease
MFYDYVGITGSAVIQSFVLAAVGYFLTKKNFLKKEGLDALSRLVIDVTLPLLIFSQLIRDFSFSKYPDWWIFPLLSVAITLAGLVVGILFLGFLRGKEHKAQFLSLVAFQNSGYLPLVLVTGILPKEKLGPMFIYIFLFLLGFNFVMFSVGVYILTLHQNKKLELASFFSPPVIATLVSLAAVLIGVNTLLPEALLAPLKMAGDCTLPLAMFVLGGGLAEIRLAHVEKKPMILLAIAKLIILPMLGLLFVRQYKLPELWGLLIVMQLAMPPATLLSVITRHYKKEDLLVSQGIFFGHILSLVTVPIFLSLYFTLTVIK